MLQHRQLIIKKIVVTEYGIVRGIVSNISVVPSGDSYTMEVTFPNNLTTTYGKELPFYHEMHATAEIIRSRP